MTMMSTRVEGVLLDIDGVLTVSWKALPGAPEALAALRRRSIPFRLLTNTTDLSRNQVHERLRDAGLEVGPDELMTAAMATRAYVMENHPGARCLIIGGGEAANEDLDGITSGREKADVVLIGGSSGSIEWDVMNRALRALLEGASLVAMHRSATWMTDEGMVMDAGVSLIAGLEEATRCEAIVCGKPAPECFRQALSSLGMAPERTIMVGDDAVSDVLAAQSLGITGVLVRTGKFRQETLEQLQEAPDHVIDSVAKLHLLL